MAHDTLPHETVSCSTRLLGALDATASADAVLVQEDEHVVLFSAHRNEVDERSLYIVPETLSVHVHCDRATLHDADPLVVAATVTSTRWSARSRR
ncbi:hypothetical protein [Lentzea sp. NPDC092896]|uniref:hypothetical protein n=1 Tax=Lentzea sp. NPDC092896 TaxID=3364127 RepID=UPI0037F38F20